MEITVQKTWKPVVAGILNIIAGVFSLLGFLGVIIAIFAVGSGLTTWNYLGHNPFSVGFVQTILIIIAIFSIIVGILPLIGGIYAIQRRRWGLVLAGSIAAVFGSTPLGIAATVFTALAKDEFS